jgi:hypothetical protein
VGPTKTVNLGPGQGDWLDLHGSTLALPFAGRAEVRPVVTLSPPNPLVGGASACLANAEILDSFSGFSLVLAPGATVTFVPEPFFPLQGVALGAGAAPESRRMATQLNRSRLLQRAVELRRQTWQTRG